MAALSILCFSVVLMTMQKDRCFRYVLLLIQRRRPKEAAKPAAPFATAGSKVVRGVLVD